MPRQARKKSATGIYHVMLRGINRSTIFHEDEDRIRFLRNIKDSMTLGDEQAEGATKITPAILHAYCLMDNHAHLLLQEGSGTLSEIMKRIGIRYASYYKWKYQSTGHVFQDRFRSQPVEDDGYFLAVFRYIALNPVRAGVAKEPGEYNWCSYRYPLPSSLPAEFPLDLSPQQLDEFIRSDRPELHPFRERISDREAEQILLRVTGLSHAAEFCQLPKPDQKRFVSDLYYRDLSIPQISRLSGLPVATAARYLN